MQVRRGDIYYADLSPVVGSDQGGLRPVLIIQNDTGNRHSPTVICAAITSRMNKAKLPTHVEIDARQYQLVKNSVILLEQIRTIDKQRVKDLVCHLDKNIMTKVDGKKIHNYREFSYYMYLDYAGDKIPITIVRDGEEKNIEVTPMYNKERSQYMIGITWSGYQKVNPLKTLEYSFREVGLQVKITLKSVKMLVSQKLGVKDLSGPVGIVKTVGDQYTQAAAYGLKTVFLTMANWIILISANLGVMNLLPLPALDGGRLLFLIIEAITGKAVPQNMEALVHTAGLILLMLLMVIVMYQDIVKIFM